MMIGTAEHQLGGLGPANVEVGVVFPGEPDAPVNAHVVEGNLQQRLGAGHFRHRRGYRAFAVIGGLGGMEHR